MRRPPREDAIVRVAVSVDFDGVDFYSAELEAKQIAVDMARLTYIPYTEFVGVSRVRFKNLTDYASSATVGGRNVVMPVRADVIDITEI